MIQSKMSTDNICPICKQELIIPVKLKCGHIFDYDCLLWFIYNETSMDNNCFLDKINISSSDIVPISTNTTKKIVVRWITGKEILFYVDRTCSIHRIRILLSYGLFKSKDIFDIINESKKNGTKYPVPYGIKLIHNDKTLYSKDTIDDIILEDAFDNLDNINDVIKINALKYLIVCCDECRLARQNETNREYNKGKYRKCVRV